ncbi:hypothetical protein V490_08429 [Pseudogymnoascus sp. VKM F-3557]|nr:hypothetical protein V490_08429 [Pseudogymnoascus sp. VKM F-3557]
MSSHNWSSFQTGQSQYPPFNPNTASYASPYTQASISNLVDSALTSSAPTYHHDANSTTGMTSLTLDQYKAGQRALGTSSVPTPVSKKRQLPNDQMITSPNSQVGDNSGDHQTQPKKKRARKAPIAAPPIPRSHIYIMGESLFSPEDFAAGLEHFQKILTGPSLKDDDLSKMTDVLTWSESEQRKWLAKLSPEEFAVVLFAEKQGRDQQQSVVTQSNNELVAQPQTHDAASTFSNQQQQFNGVQNGIQDQHMQNVSGFNNLSNFNQQFSPLAQTASFQQMAIQNPQGQSTQFGTHLPTFMVGPSGQLLPVQQNMFGDQSSNMQVSGSYQQQIMVNGQLMTVNLQPAFGGHQGSHFNSHQLILGAQGYVPQQHGTNVNHAFNPMGQQNPTTSYSLPSGGQSNNANQGQNFVLPTLSHAARVAEAQLRAATMRRQHADLRARGLPVPKLPPHPKLPPLLVSGPGLGNLPGAINNLPFTPRTSLANTFDGALWEKDPEKAGKGTKGSPPNNAPGGHVPTGNGSPLKFADVSGSNPVFLSHMGKAKIVDHTSRPTKHTANTTTPGAAGHNGVSGPAATSYQIQLPNSAGQLSIGPNAQGSTSPAGAAKGNKPKTSPKSKKTTKKEPCDDTTNAVSSSTIANVANALFPTSIYGLPTNQPAVGTAQAMISFPAVQNSGYSHGSLANPISLDMPSPASALYRLASKSLVSKLPFPPLPSPESSPVATSSVSRFEAPTSQASTATPAQTAQPTISSLGLPESNMPVASTSSDPEAAIELSAAPAIGSTGEATSTFASAESWLATIDYGDFDELFASIETPDLEPSTPNEPATPADSEPTDFNDSLDGFFDFLDTPGIAPSGEYVGVGVYDETQPVGLGFNMAGGQFDSMADMNFTDMDVDMGFGNWASFDSAQ